MAKRLSAILTAALLVSCSSKSDKQLEAVKSARSTLAEWALVEEQARNGRAPATYVSQMREQSREQLKNAQEQLGDQPRAARLIAQILAGSPDARSLHAAASILDQLEKSLERS